MKLHVPIALRWADLDAYGHVNNAVMLRLLEEARIRVFWANESAAGEAGPVPEGSAGGSVPAESTALIDGSRNTGTLSLIARQEIEYLAPVPYLRDPLDIQIWLGKIGGASFEVCYEVWSAAGSTPQVLFAKASSTLVLVDSTTERPRRISDVERAAWTPYLHAPVEFSRR